MVATNLFYAYERHGFICSPSIYVYIVAQFGFFNYGSATNQGERSLWISFTLLKNLTLCHILLGWEVFVGWLVSLFNGISTFVGYLIPKAFS